ncbi:hypothetical protein QUB68_28785 [Microcoleus sp. A006_D1]|uniref:hypothetical protein n=1 Tax=Microcoleus sp. A006_D1 TaxID=3055267 RepID=UPI002FD3BC2A
MTRKREGKSPEKKAVEAQGRGFEAIVVGRVPAGIELRLPSTTTGRHLKSPSL